MYYYQLIKVKEKNQMKRELGYCKNVVWPAVYVLKTLHVMAAALMSALIKNGVKIESARLRKKYQTVFYVKMTAIKDFYQK